MNKNFYKFGIAILTFIISFQTLAFAQNPQTQQTTKIKGQVQTQEQKNIPIQEKEQNTQLKTLSVGISVEQVPKAIYGAWRVTSNLASTNSPSIFKKKGVDIWNLSKDSNVLKLENPFSGASATVTITELKGNYIKFQKIGMYDNKKLTDTVKMRINQSSFTGINELKLETISNGHITSSECATYNIQGEKISGESIKD